MTQTATIRSSALQADPSETFALGRRRVGREAASPQLLPLLRAPAPGAPGSDDIRRLLDEPPSDPDADDDAWAPRDPIAPARGVALGVALCLPVWGAIGGLLYVLLK